MPARAYWSGQIRLALVSIPVEIFSASRSSAGISFNQIHEPTGKRVKYAKTVPGVGEIDPDEIVKGYEYEKGRYVTLTDDEIENVRLESRKTLELTQFVDGGEVEPIYYEKPYWVVPQDELAEEAFRVVRGALRQTRKVGLGQLALRGRETLVGLKPCGRGMLLETLRYAEEVNKAAPFFRAISDEPSPPELLDLAKTLIERKTAPFDPAKFTDRYETALRALVEEKVRGEGAAPAPAPEAAPRPTNVVDLMAALKTSLERAPAAAANDPGEPPAAARPKRAATAKPKEAKPAPARKRA